MTRINKKLKKGWWQATSGLVFVLMFALLGALFGERVRANIDLGTNIDPTVRTEPPYNSTDATSTFWGWNEIIGWIDFHNNHTVTVKNRNLTGYADSSVGEISLDCGTSPKGNICQIGGSGQSEYGVLNDGGNLSGWAWNDLIGWIGFCGGQGTSTCPTIPSSFPFQARIENAIVPDLPPSDFIDYAWNDVVGWISFNCESLGHSGYCATGLDPDYRARTSWFVTSTFGWLDSSTFDTEVPGGAHYNSIFWRGEMPAGTGVSFQLASSNCPGGEVNPPVCDSPPPGGVWSETEFLGPSGTSDDDFRFNSGLQLDKEHNQYYFINLADGNPHANKRYFRYRVWLFSNSNSTLSPRVDEIIINWSL